MKLGVILILKLEIFIELCACEKVENDLYPII